MAILKPYRLLAPLLCLLLPPLVGVGDSVSAQPPVGPAMRPTTSPYLNLLQGGGSPATNYYGIVRPVQEFRRQNTQFSSQLSLLQGRENQSTNQAALPDTGHAAGFMTAGSYFMNLGGQLPQRNSPAAMPSGPPQSPTGGARPATRR
jgi:hypothetical protein